MHACALLHRRARDVVDACLFFQEEVAANSPIVYTAARENSANAARIVDVLVARSTPHACIQSSCASYLSPVPPSCPFHRPPDVPTPPPGPRPPSPLERARVAAACRSLACARAARNTCACKPWTPSGGARASPSHCQFPSGAWAAPSCPRCAPPRQSRFGSSKRPRSYPGH